MAAELSDYDTYNTLAEQVEGPKPRPKAVKPKPVLNEYEALNQSGVETSILGRNQSEVNRKDDGPGNKVLGENINESRALNQSTTENMFSSLAKGTGLMVSTIGSTFTTLPEGIVRASISGFDDSQTKEEAFSKLYDNTSAEYWKKFNDAAEVAFPVYKPDSYDRESLIQNMGTSQFWGETVLKNAGFTAGAIVGGGVIGKGVSKSFQLIGKIAGSAKALENAAMVETLVQGGLSKSEALAKVAGNISYASSKAQQLATGSIVSFGEASMEAKQTYDELGEKLISKYQAEHNGELPEGEDLNKIRQYQASAGNVNLAFNMAVLTGSDTFQFGKLWQRGFTQEVKKAGEIATKDALHSAVKKSIGRKTVEGLVDYGANTLSETVEEGSQTFSNAALTEYYSRKYDKKGISSTNDSIMSVLFGMQETFGTKGGLESMLAGAITGFGSHAITKGIGKLVSAKSPSEYEQAIEVANTLNKAGNKVKPYLDSIIRQHSINQAKENNARSSNPSKKLHEDLNNEEYRAFVQPYIQTGNFSALEDKLNQEYAKDEIRFKEDNGENATRKTGKEFIGKLMQEAKSLKKNWESVEDSMPKAHPAVKEIMWGILSDIDNRNDRKTTLNSEVLAAIGVPYIGQSKKEYLQQVKEAQRLQGKINPSITQKANDIADLAEDINNKNTKVEELDKPEVQAKVIEEDNTKLEEVNSTEPTVEQEEAPIDNSQVEQEGDSVDELFTDSPEATKETTTEIDKPVEITLDKNKVEARYNAFKSAIQRMKEAGESTELINNSFKLQLDNPKISAEDREAINKILDELESPEQGSESESKTDETPAILPIIDQLDTTPPVISDDVEVHSNYLEMDKMSDTGFRSTADHDEAIKLGLNSVLRYQNWLSNPKTDITASGYRLKVVTPADELYNKLLNKKQRGFETKRKAEGKEVSGILAVVVDENDNLVIVDHSGKVEGNSLTHSIEDIDNEFSGVLVTTLASKLETKDSGFNTVSYKSFASSIDIIGDAYNEKDIHNTSTVLGKAWKEHKDKVAKARADMSSGKVKYLAITGSSPGIFNDTKASNQLDKVLGISINSDEISFIIPGRGGLTEDIDTPGFVEIGPNEGLNNKQKVKVGKPYAIYAGKLYPLTTAQLGEERATEIAVRLEKLDRNDVEGTKKELKSIGRIVHLPLNIVNDILTGKLAGSKLIDELKVKFRQVDAKYLTATTQEGNKYRERVLTGNDRILSANYNTHPTSTKDVPNYKNAYLTYKPIDVIEIVEPTKESTKTEPTVETKQVDVAAIVEAMNTTIELTPTQKKVELAKLRAKKATRKEEDDRPILPPTNREKGLGRRTSLQDSTKKEDINKIRKWFQDRFNGESFEVVDSLINGNAFGEYTAAATRLFAGAEEGTVYHEAFHKVTQEYLTAKQVKSLYDTVRKNVNNKFTDLQAEEWLAEQFRGFVLNGKKAIKNMPYTNNVFRKLYNWIKSLVTGKTTPQQVFEKLASKKGYTGAKKFNNAQFTKLNKNVIEGTTHQQTKNIVESINSHFFRRLFAANLTPDQIFGSKSGVVIPAIYDRVYKSLVNNYEDEYEFYLDDLHSEEEWQAISAHYELMLNMKDGVPTSLSENAKKAHKQYLKGLGIEFNDSTDKEVQSDKDARADDSEDAMGDESTGRDKAEWKNANEESPFNSTPNSVKMLLLSLPEIDNEGNQVTNNIGVGSLVDINKIASLLYDNLKGLTDFSDMYNRLVELSTRFPAFKELTKRLGAPGSNKNFHQMMLENDFRQAFSKFESKGTITLIDEITGKIYQVDANANKLRDRIRENWNANLRGKANNNEGYVTRSNEGVITLKAEFASDGKKFVGNYKQLFNELGIEFTDLTQEQVQELPEIKEVANAIFKYVSKAIKENTPINDLFAKDVDISGQLNKLLDVEQKLSKETVELSYMSAEGKRIYAISLNSYHTLVVNKLNNVKNKQQLFDEYPHLDNPFTVNSVWLSSLFDKDGVKIPGKRVYMNTVSGIKIVDNDKSGVGATKMEPSDKIVQEINDLLGRGSTSLIRAADKSSEYAFGVTDYDGSHLVIPLDTIPEKGLDTAKIREVFFGYFMDELNSIRAFTEIKDADGNVIKESVGKNFAIYNKQAGNFRLFADILSPETLSELEAYKTTTDELSAGLKAKIEQETVNYLSSYAKDVKDMMEAKKVGLKTEKGFTGINPEFTDTEKGRSLNKAIKAFTVNHLIQMQEQAKLLIGDSAFYKDKAKRIPAGTGTKKFAASSKTLDNWLNSFYKLFPRKDGKVANGRLRTVIYNDVQAQSNNIQDYTQALVDSGISEKEAKKILGAYAKWNEEEGKYEPSMDEGDAQGWITLDEYREFMMRVGGAYWTEKHESQYQYETKLEAGEEVGENPNFYFMPIKAQHFGPQVADNIYAPAFHKYSLAPLYMSLVRGRNMESLLTSMRENQIGYALFASGSKVGTPLNSKGNIPAFYTKGEMSGITESTPVQELYYENLGIQLDIAPKVKDKNIFGSQFRKLLFSNLFGENAKDWAKPLADEYNKIIDDLVNYEFKALTNKLGIKTSKDKDGNYESFTFNGDYTKLINELRRQLDDKDTADNILDSLQTKEDGSLVYPIDGLVNRPKIEAMLFSVVNNKVLKQKMTGNALVQLASTGFEPKGKREVDTSNYLKFYEKGKDGASTSKMEVEIPMNKTFEPLLKKYGSINAINEAISKGEVDQKHLTMVGYRIPTQGLNSMDAMTIKKFLPNEAGIAIILPTEVVAKSGGDYDIDKLNVFMPNIPDFDNPNKEFDKTSKEAMQNRIIEIASQVLTHPDNFIDLITPNTTDTLVDLVNQIRYAQSGSNLPFEEWIKDNKAPKASPTKEFRFDWIMEQFTYFLGGKAGVGIGAVHNTHHILSQIAGVKINAKLPFKANTDNEKLDLSRQYTKGGQKISDIISQFINAYVDVAKDPFYKDLNAGTEVAGIWFYLLRAGVDVNTIGYFMTQPIIKEYVAAKKLNSSLVVSSNGIKKFNRALSGPAAENLKSEIEYLSEALQSATTKDQIKEIGDQIKKAQKTLNTPNIFDEVTAKYGVKKLKKSQHPNMKTDNANSKLLQWISEGSTKDEFSNEFRVGQSYLLQKFLMIEKHAGELTKLMQVTNQDTTKLQNFGSIEQKNRKIAEVEASTIIPKGTRQRILDSTIVGSFDKGANIGDMYKELSIYASNNVVYNALAPLVGDIYNNSKKDFNKEYVKLQNDLIGYITQKFGKTLEGEPLINKMSLLTGENSLAKQLVDLRKEGVEDIVNNPFIKELVAMLAADKTSPSNVKLWSRKMNAFESNVMTEAFRQILESNEPRISEFGRNLVYAAILQSGLNNSPITFTELIPYEYYGDLVSAAIKDAKLDKAEMAKFTKAYYHKQNSRLGFRLQDFGLGNQDNTPTISDEQVEADKLVNQEDAVVDVLDTESIEGTNTSVEKELLSIKKELAQVLWDRAIKSGKYSISDEEGENERNITREDIPSLKTGSIYAQDDSGDVTWKDILENEFSDITKKGINKYSSYSEAYNLESLIEGIADTTSEDYESSLLQFNNIKEVVPSLEKFNPSSTKDSINNMKNTAKKAEENGEQESICNV